VSGTMAAAIRFAFVKGSFLSFSWGDADEAAKVPALSLAHALRDTRVLGFLGVWFGVNIVFGVGSIAIGADGGSVAWQAHIGGFLAGLMLFSLLTRCRGRHCMLQMRHRRTRLTASDRRLRRRAISSIIFACCETRQSLLPYISAACFTAPETEPARNVD